MTGFLYRGSGPGPPMPACSGRQRQRLYRWLCADQRPVALCLLRGGRVAGIVIETEARQARLVYRPRRANRPHRNRPAARGPGPARPPALSRWPQNCGAGGAGGLLPQPGRRRRPAARSGPDGAAWKSSGPGFEVMNAPMAWYPHSPGRHRPQGPVGAGGSDRRGGLASSGRARPFSGLFRRWIAGLCRWGGDCRGDAKGSAAAQIGRPSLCPGL